MNFEAEVLMLREAMEDESLFQFSIIISDGEGY